MSNAGFCPDCGKRIRGRMVVYRERDGDDILELRLDGAESRTPFTGNWCDVHNDYVPEEPNP